MAKADLKTKPTSDDVAAFVASVEPEQRRKDALHLLDIFGEITGEPPKMWGTSMIGFGSYDYKYDSGREGNAMRTGFSPRKTAQSIYLMGAYCTPEAQTEQKRLFDKLGKHKLGKSCLYINRLEQVDMDVLKQLILNNWNLMNELYPDRLPS